MPRKANDKTNQSNTIDNNITSTKPNKKNTTATDKKSSTVTKSKGSNAEVKKANKTTKTNKETKKVASKKAETKKSTATTTTKRNTSKTADTKKSKSKSTSTKKTTNSTTKKTRSTRSKTVSSTLTKPFAIVEYYDLPFRYNQTTVKILAQTPTTLFIYWDISDDDRKQYIDNYGEDFFYKTKPYLLIRNLTMNYSFEVEIDDFANSWYLHVNDADCEYKVELIRRPIQYSYNAPETPDNEKEYMPIPEFIYITSSNELTTPNDHILFDKLGKSVFFRNVKTNVVEEKSITSISFIQNIGKVYDIYEFYKIIYKEDFDINKLNLRMPSSGSSTFK